MTIGKRVKQRRKELGMTQEELAKRVGFKSKTSINKIETGERDITQSKILAFSDALMVAPTYILGLEDEEERRVCEMDKCCKKHLMEKILLLDDVDRERLEERLDTMLEADKYVKKKKMSVG